MSKHKLTNIWPDNATIHFVSRRTGQHPDFLRKAFRSEAGGGQRISAHNMVRDLHSHYRPHP